MFSVIIPLYNKELYIVRCLTAIYNQSYKNFEVIVVNDGSTDHGVQLIKEHFPQVIIAEQHNQGASVARNVGMRLATQNYIAFIDADDEWHPDYLKHIAFLIESNDGQPIKIIGSNYSTNRDVLSTDAGNLEYAEIVDYFKIAIRNTLFLTSATVINRQMVIDNDLNFNPKYRRGQDIDLWFRINMLVGRAFYIKNTLVFYSTEDANQATRNLVDLDRTFLGNIVTDYASYYNSTEGLKRFVSLFIYLKLFPHYYNVHFHDKAKKVLDTIPQKRLWLQVPYFLPLKIGSKLIANPRFFKLIRLYLKFCIKYFY